MENSSEGAKNDRPRLNRILRSTVWTQFALWYLALLAPTLLAKYSYLSTIYHGEITVALKPLLAGPVSFERQLLFAGFFARDCREVLLLAAATFGLGLLLLRRRVRYLMPVVVFFSLLVVSVNYVALKQLGTLLTYDTLQISLHWVKADPHILLPFLSLRKILIVPLAALWSCLPLMGLHFEPPAGRWSRTLRSLSQGLLLACLTGSFSVPQSVLAKFTKSASPFRGYWSNAYDVFLELGRRNPFLNAAHPPSEIKTEYQKLAYPAGRAPQARYLTDLPAPRLRPRHIVIISLETAPQKYYPIIDNPGLPAFYRMCQHGIVNSNHLASTPYTTWSVYSVLTGTYFKREAIRLRKEGDLQPDALPLILSRHGYETTYVDTYKVDWMGGSQNRVMLKNLGFQNLVEIGDRTMESNPDSYEAQVRRERLNFEAVLKSILDAQARGHKTLTFATTLFGHFPWKAKPEDEARPAAEKIRSISGMLDGLLADFLKSLDQHGLSEDVLIVLLGDHGLRYRAEFESLDEDMKLGDVAFNVPFILYAPALLRTEVALPYVTSHVDIAPTVLELIGISPDLFLFHGQCLLDRRLEHRITFTINLGLSPVDGFHWAGSYYTVNNLTGEVLSYPRTRQAHASIDLSHPPDKPAFSEQEVRDILEKADTLFDATLACFLRRKSPSPLM